MRKHNDFFEEIVADMWSSEKRMPEKRYAIADEVVLEKLKQVENLEQTDRDGRTLLINAAFYGRKSAIEHLLSRQANINAKDKNGYTALHAAAQEGDIEIIKLLLENGADVHAKDAHGNTPVSKVRYLMSREGTAIFTIFLKYGADPNDKNDYGMSVMDMYQAYPDVLSILRGDRNTL